MNDILNLSEKEKNKILKKCIDKAINIQTVKITEISEKKMDNPQPSF